MNTINFTLVVRSEVAATIKVRQTQSVTVAVVTQIDR